MLAGTSRLDDPPPHKESFLNARPDSATSHLHERSRRHNIAYPSTFTTFSEENVFEEDAQTHKSSLGGSGGSAIFGVSISAEQMAELSSDKRALLEKLAHKLPTLEPHPLPTTPMLAPNMNKMSPPSPPPPPQPPTPGSACSLGPDTKDNVDIAPQNAANMAFGGVATTSCQPVTHFKPHSSALAASLPFDPNPVPESPILRAHTSPTVKHGRRQESELMPGAGAGLHPTCMEYADDGNAAEGMRSLPVEQEVAVLYNTSLGITGSDLTAVEQEGMRHNISTECGRQFAAQTTDRHHGCAKSCKSMPLVPQLTEEPPTGELHCTVSQAVWKHAEEHKERGNRRYAIKSWIEACTCYLKAITELKKHPAFGNRNSAEGCALYSKAASYHANAAAAFMQQGKMVQAVAQCQVIRSSSKNTICALSICACDSSLQAAIHADCKLGKALLRGAHIQLLLGDIDQARKHYVDAARVGHPEESDVGLKACVDDEQQIARLTTELVMFRRGFASTGGATSSLAQLKRLLSTMSTACKRTPHHIQLLSLRAQVLSASGRISEAVSFCDEQLSAPHAHNAHAAIWLFTFGRVLYDASMLPEAAEKLAESMQRSHVPPECRPLALLVQRLESERSTGNKAFKRADWWEAIDAYTRALAIDPTHVRFNAIIYCNRGAAHAKNGSLQEALADCSAAITLNRSYAKAYLRRGELRVHCSDNARALEDFEAARRLDSNGAVGLEAARRISNFHRDSARANAGAPKANKSRGWERERKGSCPPNNAGYPSGGAFRRPGAGCTSSASSKKPDYYEVLGVLNSASSDEIRRAYKRMCLKYHPDKCSGSDMEVNVC